MSTLQTKYAIDLSNEGVALWHRDEKKQWILLGKVALDAPNFSDDIENIKNGYTPDSNGEFVARVRIPRSEVFVSEINLAGTKDDTIKTAVIDFLNEKTPYAADELFYDLDQSTGGNPSYIAAVTKQTISEAKDFVTGHGFQAAYYTTKLDKADFPRDARFYDGPPPPPVVPVDLKKPETPRVVPVEKEEVQDAVPPIPTPPTPKPVEVAQPNGETLPKVEETPPVIEKTDFSAFETVRSKELIAPNKHGDVKEPSVSKGSLPSPARRLSIGMSEGDAIREPEKPIGLVAGTLKTPQGKTSKPSIKDKFKPRHYLIIIALLMIALGYWFITTLFDGKAEIARLHETPTPEVVVEAPAVEPQAVEIKPEPKESAPVPETDIAVLPEDAPAIETPVEVEAIPPVQIVEELPQEIEQQTEIAQTVEEAPEENVAEVVETPTLVEEPAEVAVETPAEEAPAEVVVETPVDEAPAPEKIIVATQEPVIEDLIVETETAEEATQDTTVVETVEVETPPVPLVDLIPTKDGTLGAEGITLYAGVPDIIPPIREQLKISPNPLKDFLPKMRSTDFAEVHKAEIEAVAQQLALAQEAETPVLEEDVAVVEQVESIVEETPQELDLLALADPTLKAIQPRVRPAIIADRVKEIAAATLAPPADPELAALKPRQRPSTLKILKEEIQPEQVDPSEIQIAIQEAVRDIARPRARPAKLSRTVANQKAAEKKAARQESVQTAALTPKTARGTSKPSSATGVSVQRQATEKAGINKRRISLIGVYGKASSRRALVRMPSGRYVKVKSGQKFSGWNVAAIGESSVRITKGSRNQVLRMPKN